MTALALLAAASAAAPATTTATGHSGTPRVRTSPELSDVALFVFAVIGVWLLRRALRKRSRRD